MDLDKVPGRNGESSTQKLPQVAQTAERLAAARIVGENVVGGALGSSRLERAGEPEAMTEATECTAERSAASGSSNPGITGVSLEVAESKSLDLEAAELMPRARALFFKLRGVSGHLLEVGEPTLRRMRVVQIDGRRQLDGGQERAAQ